jgi:hypothetical protein
MAEHGQPHYMAKIMDVKLIPSLQLHFETDGGSGGVLRSVGHCRLQVYMLCGGYKVKSVKWVHFGHIPLVLTFHVVPRHAKGAGG